jgi:CDP-diacylglycerol--glycerol-3-phosphate 3-phosphatidyltransferase
MKGAIKTNARLVLEYPARALAGLGATANHLTLTGLFLSVVSGVLLGIGCFGWSSVFLILAGFCDMLDGAVARARNESSVFGAHLDSSVDRLAEALFFGGAIYLFYVQGEPFYILLAYMTAVSSFLISYTRARAEGLGVDCQVGLMERPERIILLILALWFGPLGLKVALWVLTPLALYTTWQRINHVYKSTR